jgi:hypothetical protein
MYSTNERKFASWARFWEYVHVACVYCFVLSQPEEFTIFNHRNSYLANFFATRFHKVACCCPLTLASKNEIFVLYHWRPRPVVSSAEPSPYISGLVIEAYVRLSIEGFCYVHKLVFDQQLQQHILLVLLTLGYSTCRYLYTLVKISLSNVPSLGGFALSHRFHKKIGSHDFSSLGTVSWLMKWWAPFMCTPD